jgi:hypothetical protein
MNTDIVCILLFLIALLGLSFWLELRRLPRRRDISGGNPYELIDLHNKIREQRENKDHTGEEDNK